MNDKSNNILRKKKVISNEKRKNQKYLNNNNYYINRTVKNIVDIDIPLHERLQIIEMRLNRLYNALSFTNIVKATPIVTLVYEDTEQCRKRNMTIYNNWTKYFTHFAHYNGNLKFMNIFNAIDEFILDGFFRNKVKQSIKVYALDNININIYYDTFLHEDRYPGNYKLKHPENKEYISYNIDDNNINLYYFLTEITNLENAFSNNNNNNDILNPLKNNHSVVNNLDTNVINVNVDKNNNNQLIYSDKRFVVLGAQRPLFNTTIDTTTINNFNDNLSGVGVSLVNISLVIFHCMLHLKCHLENKNDHKNHTDEFLNEYINFLPSVLFGHTLLPRVTIKT